MPEILQHSQIASREAHVNDLAMAFLSLKDRFDWPNANGTSSVQIRRSRSRLFHQVGGGQTLRYDLHQKGLRVYLGVHYLHFWDTI